jgi:hypothetical protein
VAFSGYSDFLHPKTDHYDITEKLLNVALNTITLPPPLASVYSAHFANIFIYKTGFLQLICIYTRTDICKEIG